MVYGDLQFFDIIIFAAIAVFLIYRLRNVLGKRGGFEKKRLHNPPQEKESEQIGGNVAAALLTSVRTGPEESIIDLITD